MKRKLIALAVFIAVITGVCFAFNFESVSQHYAEKAPKHTKIGNVTISIRCDKILEHQSDLSKSLKDSNVIPKNGIILQKTTVSLFQNDTVYDILNRITKERKIQIETSGAETSAGSTLYVRGIDYIYEMSCGSTSGWIYFVNEKKANVGASDYCPKNGDDILWAFSCKENDYE
ncbi:MAG: DUF4430 domain-containing protein [Bacillota bacterium]|nr:DUF4430 domain-containing protein [Bacillota bacterium]